MAGGLYKDRPFAFNVKCIIFSLMCMALFLYCPNKKTAEWKRYVALFVVFVVSYVAMAWYDHFFDCRTLPLRRGTASITGTLKPYVAGDSSGSSDSDSRPSELRLIYLSHVLIIVPTLVYIALRKRKASRIVYPLLGVVSFMTLLYHGNKLIA